MTNAAHELFSDPVKAAVIVKELLELPDFDFWKWTSRFTWLAHARDKQKPPQDDDWTIWFLRGGRGSGKTRVGAEETWFGAATTPGTRWLVCAPTAADIRDTCFEGESGLRAVIPPQLIRDYNRSLSEIILKNGSLIKGIPASEPDRLRGPQWHGVWLDELAAMQYPQETFDMIMMAMRLGQHPRMVVTTTPRPTPIIRDLVKRKDTVVTIMITHDNLQNLSPTFRQQIQQYEGTALGRQELYAEILDPEESGIIKRSWFPLWPAGKPLPKMEYVVLSYDTAFTQKTMDKESGNADYTACLAIGIFQHGQDKRTAAMIIDAWHERLGYPQLRARVMKDSQVVFGPQREGKRADLMVIEKQGAGIPLFQELGATGVKQEIFPYNPGNIDKLARLHLVSPLVKQGRIWLVESESQKGRPKSWYGEMLGEVCAFHGEGTVEHDDYVDAFSQALRVLRDMGWLKLDAVPREPLTLPYDKKTGTNPYAQ